MKLTTELKNRIDRYFEKISADELYAILTTKYHLKDIDDDKYATVIHKTEYYPVIANTYASIWDSSMCLRKYKGINEGMSYDYLNIENNFGEVQTQMLSNTSNIQENINDDCVSIPLAA